MLMTYCLIAETEQDIQEILDILNVWCHKWKLQVNSQKTEVVHFHQGPSVERTQFKFHCGDSEIFVVDKYKYLGLVFSEFLDYGQMTKLVVQSTHWSLDLLVVKCKSHCDMPFTCFSKLYDFLVQPIINFGAATWGHRNFTCSSPFKRFWRSAALFAHNTGSSANNKYVNSFSRNIASYSLYRTIL